MTNTEIDEFLGRLSYYAVSKISTRFSEKLKMDKKHNKAVQEIVAHLSQAKA